MTRAEAFSSCSTLGLNGRAIWARSSSRMSFGRGHLTTLFVPKHVEVAYKLALVWMQRLV